MLTERQEKFEDNFWQGYSVMQGNFIKNKKYFSQFFFVFYQLSNIHETYSQSLSRLCSFFERPEGKDLLSPFYQVMVSFIDQLQEESTKHHLLAEEAKAIAERNIAETLNDLGKLFSKEATTQKMAEEESETVIFNNLTKFKTLETRYKDMHSECNKYKAEYFDALTNTLHEHSQKQNFVKHVLTGVEHDDFNNEEVLNKQRLYLARIKDANALRGEYIASFKQHAQIFQTIDLTYMSTIKESILKYSHKKKEQLTIAMECLETKVQNVLDKLNLSDMQALFIDNNKTFGFPPGDLTFTNYSVSSKNFILLKGDDDDPNSANTSNSNHRRLQILQKFISTFIEKPTAQDQEITTLFGSLMNEEMTEEQFELIQSKFKSNNNVNSLDNALIFLNLLNNYRANKCYLNKKHFLYLAELLCLIAALSRQNGIEFHLKYKCINWLIILSQTFYTLNDGGDDHAEQEEKVYLFEELIVKDVFSDINWFDFFKYVLYDNVKTTLKYKDDYRFELTPQDQEMIKRIIQSKIVGVIQNMVFLKQTNESIDTVIDSLCTYYNEDKEYVTMMKEELIKSKDTAATE